MESAATPAEAASASPVAAKEHPRLCAFIEIFRTIIGDGSSASGGPADATNADGVNITPFLVHQILRGEGYAVRVLLFPNHHQGDSSGSGGNDASAATAAASGNGSSSSSNNNNTNMRRGVVQFESEAACERVMNRFGARNGVAVYLQGVRNWYLKVRTRPGRDAQVFVSDNTDFSMAATPECGHLLGIAFPRNGTSNSSGSNNIVAAPAAALPRFNGGGDAGTAADHRVGGAWAGAYHQAAGSSDVTTSSGAVASQQYRQPQPMAAQHQFSPPAGWQQAQPQSAIAATAAFLAAQMAQVLANAGAGFAFGSNQLQVQQQHHHQHQQQQQPRPHMAIAPVVAAAATPAARVVARRRYEAPVAAEAPAIRSRDDANDE